MRFGTHLWETLRLAGPVIVARSGVLIMMAVDTAMTGHAGGDELAWFGIGLSPTIALTLLGLGFLLGVVILTSQADGAGERARTGAILKTGLWHAVGIGFLFLIVCWFGEALLSAIGQSENLSRGGGAVMRMLGYGMPAVLIFVACSFYLEGLSRPLPGMVIMLGANIVNFGLNWLLIYGNGPIETAMGAEGAALATTLTRWLTAAIMLGFIWTMRERDALSIRTARADWQIARRMQRLGYPLALAMFVETVAFMAMTLAAGYLSNNATAGYQIAHNLVALVFMSAIGIGAATAVRVGNAVGRDDPPGARASGLAGVTLVVAAMAALGGLFLIMPESLVAIYTSDPAVAAYALPPLMVAGTMMVFDGAQAVLVNALRATGDVWFPMGAQMVAFWLVTGPVAWWLAFAAGHGTGGLMGGIYAGVVTATVLASLRFWVIVKRPLRRA